MAFAFMDISKIKSAGQLTSKYNHNCRMMQIDNVIPELTKDNETLISLPQKSGKTLNYNEAFQERLSSLDYYKNHEVRKNAVLGYEVLLTYSRDANIDMEAWKKQSVDWLKDTFNVAPDGKSNVLHAEFHADEVGNVHIHSFVVPIDERGRLNARRFTDGSRAMSELQSSYADAVSNLGLKRGIAGSSAKHQDIRKMYANLNNAMQIPKAMENETAIEYRRRAEEEIKTALAAGMRKADDLAVKHRQELDIQAQKERNEMGEALKKMQKVSMEETRRLELEKLDLEEEIIGYKEMMAELQHQMWDIQSEIDETEKKLKEKTNEANAREFYDKLQSGLGIMYEENPKEAMELEAGIERAVELAEIAEQMEAEKEAQIQADADMESYDI